MPPITNPTTGEVIGQAPVPPPEGKSYYMLALEDERQLLCHHVKTFVQNRHSKTKVIIKGTDVPRDPATPGVSFRSVSVEWNATDQQLADKVRECNDLHGDPPAWLLDANNRPEHDGPILFIYFCRIDPSTPQGYMLAMLPYSRATTESAQYARFLSNTIDDVMNLARSNPLYKKCALEGLHAVAADSMTVLGVANGSPIDVSVKDFFHNYGPLDGDGMILREA